MFSCGFVFGVIIPLDLVELSSLVACDSEWSFHSSSGEIGRL
jgi:hypothetical protein